MFLQCNLTDDYTCIVQLNWLLYLDNLSSKTTTVWFKRDGNIFLVLQALAIDDGILGQYTAIMGQFYSHTAVIKTAKAEIFGWPFPSYKILMQKNWHKTGFTIHIFAILWPYIQDVEHNLKKSIWNIYIGLDKKTGFFFIPSCHCKRIL